MFPGLMQSSLKALKPSIMLSIVMFTYREVNGLMAGNKKRRDIENDSSKGGAEGGEGDEEEMAGAPLKSKPTAVFSNNNKKPPFAARLLRLVAKSAISVLDFAMSYQIPMIFACYYPTHDRRRLLAHGLHIGGFLGGIISSLSLPPLLSPPPPFPSPPSPPSPP